MKKRILIIAIASILLIGITYTFSLPTFFSVKTVSFVSNMRIKELRKKLDPNYSIDEPIKIVSNKEDEIISFAIEVLSTAIGAPNTTIDNSYFAAKSRFKAYQKYLHSNSDIQDENGNVLDGYSLYLWGSWYTDETKGEYEFEELYKLNIISYSKIEFVSIRTNDSSKFNVRLKVSGIKHKIQNPKTGEDEIEEGELTAELIILKNLDNLKLLDLYSYSIKPYSSETQSINNEVDSLSGKISFNSIDSEYTDEEVEAFVDIYKKYRNRILSFNEVNENQVTISNSTGFIYEDGIVIANWTWFENYLTSGNKLVITDYKNRVYEIEEIISISSYYDIVLLKTNDYEEERETIYVSSFFSFLSNEKFVSLTSPRGIGITLNIGIVLGKEGNISTAIFSIADGEIGAPVFTNDGTLFGFITSDKASNIVSIANIGYDLYKLDTYFNEKNIDDTKTYKLDELLKELNNFNPSDIEINKNMNYDQKVFEKYMQYFDIREIYKDNIANILTKDNYMIIRVSYANDNLISKKQYTNLYVMKLVEAGFKEILSNDFSRTLRKDNIIINIMYETNYISIVYREE